MREFAIHFDATNRQLADVGTGNFALRMALVPAALRCVT
jgi:hypothetical protein